MKKYILSLLLALLPFVAHAEAVEIDGIWYNLVSKVKTAEVTQNPNLGKYTGSYAGSIEIPDKVNYKGVDYSVVSIGIYAFRRCYSLKSVTIPNSVTSIGDWAFLECSGLTSITIPNNVTSIGGWAFGGCSGLTSITIPNSVTNIGGSAFQNCSGLISITIPNSVTSINGIFRNCSGLTSITIPNSVTSIDDAFSGCSGLTSITIPNKVTSIGDRTFQECTSLTSVTIPNSVTSIGNQAFSGCSNLTSITIPNSITSISESAFANCPELTDVTCLAEELKNEKNSSEGLYTYVDAFNDSYIEYATLHVPAAAIPSYKSMEPWSKFKSIVPVGDGEIPETPKCVTPTITYSDGKISFACETEGVEFVSEITTADAKNNYSSEIAIGNIYTVTVYATKAGYDDSEKVSLNFTANGLQGDVDGDGKVDVADHVKLSEIIMNQAK